MNITPSVLLVHILSLKKCKVVGCDEMFNAYWCCSFGLSKLVIDMFGSIKKEEATLKLGSPQLWKPIEILQTSTTYLLSSKKLVMQVFVFVLYLFSYILNIYTRN